MCVLRNLSFPLSLNVFERFALFILCYSVVLEERLDIDYIRPIEHHNMGMAGYHSISIHSTGATVTCCFIGGLGVDDVACIHHKLLTCSISLQTVNSFGN